MIVNTNYKERLGAVMKFKVGDVVEFKKYEDMTGGEAMGISEESFPKYGKITEIGNDGFFFIEGYGYLFDPKSVTRIISDVDDVDINNLNVGDEVLMKVTIGEIKGDHIWISWVNKKDIVKILKRKEPERFIVKEDYYGMYIGTAQKLVGDKSKAKIYTSRNTANEDAADMHLNAWDVIKYE